MPVMTLTDYVYQEKKAALNTALTHQYNEEYIEKARRKTDYNHQKQY